MRNVKQILLFSLLFIIVAPMAASAKDSGCPDVSPEFRSSLAAKIASGGVDEAVRSALAEKHTPAEIICTALSIDGISTLEIIVALRNANVDPVLIKLAAELAGLNATQIDALLDPNPAHPGQMPVLTGTPSARGVVSPSTIP